MPIPHIQLYTAPIYEHTRVTSYTFTNHSYSFHTSFSYARATCWLADNNYTLWRWINQLHSTAVAWEWGRSRQSLEQSSPNEAHQPLLHFALFAYNTFTHTIWPRCKMCTWTTKCTSIIYFNAEGTTPNTCTLVGSFWRTRTYHDDITNANIVDCTWKF